MYSLYYILYTKWEDKHIFWIIASSCQKIISTCFLILRLLAWLAHIAYIYFFQIKFKTQVILLNIQEVYNNNNTNIKQVQ